MTMRTRVWRADQTPARSGRPRPNGGPGKASTRPAEPDALLEGKPVSVHLISGEVLTGTLRRAGRYLLVIRTPEGEEIALYKHAISYLKEA